MTVTACTGDSGVEVDATDGMRECVSAEIHFEMSMADPNDAAKRAIEIAAKHFGCEGSDIMVEIEPGDPMEFQPGGRVTAWDFDVKAWRFQ